MSMPVFTEVTYPLSALMDDIRLGEIGLPDIQRPFVWPNTKVRDLFDSMYQGFPVGYLLFWVNAAANGHRQIGADAKQLVPHLLIVDGQQRLTSLYAVLNGLPVVREDYQQERIYIAFCPRDRRFEVADAAIRRDPEYIPDISVLWSNETPVRRFEKSFLANLRLSREVSEEDEERISEAIGQLHALKSYPFSALQLSADLNEEQVAEVFVRVNSKGTPLNQADFILTLMSVFWDEGRAELEKFCRTARTPSNGAPTPYNAFIQPDPDQLLRVDVGLGFHRARLQHVYSILRGKDLETGVISDERRERQFAILKEAQSYVLDLLHWHDFLKVLLRAGYRAGWMISSKIGLLYTYALYLIGKRDFGVDNHTLREVMARWFFMSLLTGRYTGSPESVMEQDLARLREVKDGDGFVAVLDRIIEDTFTEDYWNIYLPNALATSSPRSPSLFAYYAALNLLHSRVLFSKMTVPELLDPAVHPRRAALERHHLFPRAYLSRLGITDLRDVNQIANFALVEWDDNVEISDKAPSTYVPAHASRFTSEELSCMYYWHALPEGWEQADYHEFLEERRKAIARVIRDGYRKLTKAPA